MSHWDDQLGLTLNWVQYRKSVTLGWGKSNCISFPFPFKTKKKLQRIVLHSPIFNWWVHRSRNSSWKGEHRLQNLLSGLSQGAHLRRKATQNHFLFPSNERKSSSLTFYGIRSRLWMILMSLPRTAPRESEPGPWMLSLPRMNETDQVHIIWTQVKSKVSLSPTKEAEVPNSLSLQRYFLCLCLSFVLLALTWAFPRQWPKMDMPSQSPSKVSTHLSRSPCLPNLYPMII